MSFSSFAENSGYLDGVGNADPIEGSDADLGFAPDTDSDEINAGMCLDAGEIPMVAGALDLGAAYFPADADDPESGAGEPGGSDEDVEGIAETMTREFMTNLGTGEYTEPASDNQRLSPHPVYDANNPPTADDYRRLAGLCIETRFPDESPEERQVHAEQLAKTLLENDLARQAARGEAPMLPDSAEEMSDEEVREWQDEQAAVVISHIEDVTNNDPEGERFSVDRDGIFLPTEGSHVLATLRAANPQPGEKMIDIGSGDGRWPMVASTVLGMDAYGYERSNGRHRLAERVRNRLLDEGIEEAADVHLLHEDFFGADISDADVIVYYLGGGPSKKQVENKIMREAKDGARVIFYGLFEPDYVSEMTVVIDNVPDVSMPTRVYRVDRQPQQP